MSEARTATGGRGEREGQEAEGPASQGQAQRLGSRPGGRGEDGRSGQRSGSAPRGGPSPARGPGRARASAEERGGWRLRRPRAEVAPRERGRRRTTPLTEDGARPLPRWRRRCGR